MVLDAIYAGAGARTASDNAVKRVRDTVQRFLEQLPGELTVADMLAELREPE